MAIDYNRMRQTALRLITENGRGVVVKNRTGSNQDPVAGTVDVSFTDVDAFAVFVSITDQNRPTSDVQQGDKFCFVTEEVASKDLILDYGDGESWEVIDVDEKFPGPLKLVWKVVVRK